MTTITSNVLDRAERFVDSAKASPKVREFAENAAESAQQAASTAKDMASSAFDSMKPAIALAIPLIRKLNWRMVAFGVAAGAAGYIVRTLMEDKPAASGAGSTHKPELHRWESEGGMIATSAPSARRTNQHGDIGAGFAEPPLNS